MSRGSGRRPYDVLRLGILLLTVGTLLVPGLLLWGGAADGPPSFLLPGIGIALLLVAAGLGLMWYSRRLRRSQRPEWLETRAWRKNLGDKLKQGQPHGAGSPPAAKGRNDDPQVPS